MSSAKERDYDATPGWNYTQAQALLQEPVALSSMAPAAKAVVNSTQVGKRTQSQVTRSLRYDTVPPGSPELCADSANVRAGCTVEKPRPAKPCRCRLKGSFLISFLNMSEGSSRYWPAMLVAKLGSRSDLALQQSTISVEDDCAAPMSPLPVSDSEIGCSTTCGFMLSFFLPFVPLFVPCQHKIDLISDF